MTAKWIVTSILTASLTGISFGAAAQNATYGEKMAWFNARPAQDSMIMNVKECTGNTFQCRLGVSTWCCENGKTCDTETGGCK